METVMTSAYRGLYLIGDKATNRIMDVQVEDIGGISIPLPFHTYVARGIEPPWRTLPWQEDIKFKAAEPKPQSN